MIATNVRRLSVYLVLSFAAVSGALTWWQVIDAQELASRPDNPQVIAAHRSLPRGSIFDRNDQVLAETVPQSDTLARRYPFAAAAPVVAAPRAARRESRRSPRASSHVSARPKFGSIIIFIPS